VNTGMIFLVPLNARDSGSTEELLELVKNDSAP
jgi:hypothetical protein